MIFTHSNVECVNFDFKATKDGVTNSGYVDDEQQAVVAIDQASRAHLDSSPGWTRNQIKEETRQKLDQDQNAARERLGLVRRELSMLAASRDTINIVSGRSLSSNQFLPIFNTL